MDEKIDNKQLFGVASPEKIILYFKKEPDVFAVYKRVT